MPESFEAKDPARPATLVCLPFAGGGAAGYFRWARRLAPAIRVVPAELPGRDRLLHDPMPTSADALLDHLDRTCAPHLNGLFAFYGHSLGALIAALWTLRLQARGRALPECVFLGARGAPAVVRPEHSFGGFDDDALLRALDARFGGTSAADLADPELRALLLPTLRADLHLVETISPASFTAPLRVPVHLLHGVDDPATGTASLAAWGTFVEAPLETHALSGGHFFHFGAGEDETLALLARTLHAAAEITRST